MFLSWSRSSETGWSTTVKVLPSFSSWSSSWFCCSLSGFCSGPRVFCKGQERTVVRHRAHHWTESFSSLPSDAPSCSSWSWWWAGIRQTGRGRRPPALRSLVTKCRLAASRVAQTIKVLSSPFRNWKCFSCFHLWAPVSPRAAGSGEKWGSPAWPPSGGVWDSEREAVSQARGKLHLLTRQPERTTFDLGVDEFMTEVTAGNITQSRVEQKHLVFPWKIRLLFLWYLYLYTQTLNTHKQQLWPQGRRPVCLSPRLAATPRRLSAASPSGSCPATSPSPPNHLRTQRRFNQGEERGSSVAER